MYTIINVHHSLTRTIQLHIHMVQFPLSPFPLAGSPLLPFVSPSTYLAPSSCDRNRPPPSQVACKLTPFVPPFTQLSHPFQIPTTPTAPCLTMTTSGIFRLLLSGTKAFEYFLFILKLADIFNYFYHSLLTQKT